MQQNKEEMQSKTEINEISYKGEKTMEPASLSSDIKSDHPNPRTFKIAKIIADRTLDMPTIVSKLATFVCDGFTEGAKKNIICVYSKCISIVGASPNKLWYASFIQSSDQVLFSLGMLGKNPKISLVVLEDSILIVSLTRREIYRVDLIPKTGEIREQSVTSFRLLRSEGNYFDLSVLGRRKGFNSVYVSLKYTTKKLDSWQISFKEFELFEIYKLTKKGFSLVLSLPKELVSLSPKDKTKIIKRISSFESMLNNTNITEHIEWGRPIFHRRENSFKIFDFDTKRSSLKLLISINRAYSTCFLVLFDLENKKILRRKLISVLDLIGEKKIRDLSEIGLNHLKKMGLRQRKTKLCLDLSFGEYRAEDQILTGSARFAQRPFENYKGTSHLQIDFDFIFSAKNIFRKLTTRSISIPKNLLLAEEISPISYHEGIGSFVYFSKKTKFMKYFSKIKKVDSKTLTSTVLFDDFVNYFFLPKFSENSHYFDLGEGATLKATSRYSFVFDRLKKRMVIHYL